MTILSGESQAGDNPGLLPACPDTPNCVSSQAPDSSHFVAPFRLKVQPSQGWENFMRILASQPGIKISRFSANALHAEAVSRVFRFVDNIDAVLDEAAGVIHIRSASRLGYSDFGVNRKRVEQLRLQLQQQHIIF